MSRSTRPVHTSSRLASGTRFGGPAVHVDLRREVRPAHGGRDAGNDLDLDPPIGTERVRGPGHGVLGRVHEAGRIAAPVVGPRTPGDHAAVRGVESACCEGELLMLWEEFGEVERRGGRPVVLVQG